MDTTPPFIFPSSVHPKNRGAIDIGWHKLIAYASHRVITIIDSQSLHIIQTLEHRGKASASSDDVIAILKWARTNYYHSASSSGHLVDLTESSVGQTAPSSYPLRLISADTQGSIVVWDVVNGAAKTSFGEPGELVLALEWLGTQVLIFLFD